MKRTLTLLALLCLTLSVAVTGCNKADNTNPPPSTTDTNKPAAP